MKKKELENRVRSWLVIWHNTTIKNLEDVSVKLVRPEPNNRLNRPDITVQIVYPKNKPVPNVSRAAFNHFMTEMMDNEVDLGLTFVIEVFQSS